MGLDKDLLSALLSEAEDDGNLPGAQDDPGSSALQSGQDSDDDGQGSFSGEDTGSEDGYGSGGDSIYGEDPGTVWTEPADDDEPAYGYDSSAGAQAGYQFSEEPMSMTALMRIRGRLDDIEQMIMGIDPGSDELLAGVLSGIEEQLASIVENSSQGLASGEVRDAKEDPGSMKAERWTPEIDRGLSRIENGRLRITLLYLPANVEQISYTVSATGSGFGDTAACEEVINIPADQYRRDGMILIEPITSSRVYVSLFAQCRAQDGSMYFTEPVHLTFDETKKTKIRYRLEWLRGGGLLKLGRVTGCKLIVRSNAPLPEMKLVYRGDGHIPMTLSDPDTVVLYDVKPGDFTQESGVYIFVFPDNSWQRLSPGTELRLIITDGNPSEYEIRIEDLKSMRSQK